MEVYGVILENVMDERGALAGPGGGGAGAGGGGGGGEGEPRTTARGVQADNRAMLELLRSAQTGVYKEVVETLGQVGRAPLIHTSIC